MKSKCPHINLDDLWCNQCKQPLREVIESQRKELQMKDREIKELKKQLNER